MLWLADHCVTYYHKQRTSISQLKVATDRVPASDVSSVILCDKLTFKCIGVATRLLPMATRLCAGAL